MGVGEDRNAGKGIHAGAEVDAEVAVGRGGGEGGAVVEGDFGAGADGRGGAVGVGEGADPALVWWGGRGGVSPFLGEFFLNFFFFLLFFRGMVLGVGEGREGVLGGGRKKKERGEGCGGNLASDA